MLVTTSSTGRNAPYDHRRPRPAGRGFFITPGLLEGTVTPPSSKSQTHRAILARLLAEGGVLTVRES